MEPDRRETLRKMFVEDGLSVAQWAREHGFSAPLVYAVLNGRNLASRGESFRIAVALGLRSAPKHQSFFQTGRVESNVIEPTNSPQLPFVERGVVM